MRTQRLEYEKGASAKFWQIQVEGRKTIITYGRIGNDGRCIEKEFDSARIANAEALRLTAQKKLKGYTTAPKKKAAASNPVSFGSEIKAGKIVDVVGLIGHFGADRYYLGRASCVAFTFLHWKFNKGEKIEGSIPVILKRNVVGKKYDNALKRFQPYTIVRMKLKIQRHPEQKNLVGIIQKDYGRTEDKELKRLAKSYAKPISITDADIGKLKLDRDNCQYENRNVKWLGKKISVDIAANELAECSLEAMKLLKRIFKKPDVWEKKAKNYAAREMIENARNWQQQEYDYQESDEVKQRGPITLSEFKNRIELVSISAGSDGILFWFDDDDIFCSHAIEIGLSLNGKFDSNSITG